jgi:hypothetical protein
VLTLISLSTKFFTIAVESIPPDKKLATGTSALYLKSTASENNLKNSS